LRGYILFRYPGKSAKKFTIGEGADRLYLCPFLQSQAETCNGKITDYSGEKEEFISFTAATPYISNKEEYLEQFGIFQKAFAEKDISKAILSRVKSVANQQSPNELFEQLMTNYATAFCYVLSIEGIGNWAGASPEILLRYSDRKIETVALAGTKYSADPSVWTDKERIEHALVENYIADLATADTPLIEKTETHIVQAGNLYHLRSEFCFEGSKSEVSEFLQRIHPTPAICGLPYEDSKSLIIDTENHDRRLYCGFIGVVDSTTDAFSMYVNIRCMQLISGRAYLYIGGGITKDSVGESEWEETEKKSEVMQKVLS